MAWHAAAAGLLALHPGWWPGLASAIACNHAALAAAGMWPRSQCLGRTLFRLPAPGLTVALTFDDGPDPAVTPAVLDLLAAAGATASFFCIGDRARRHPLLLRRIVGAGHQVENHSLTHPYLFAFLSGAALRREVQDAQAILAEITGVAPAWFRAPMGFRGPLLDHALAQAGLRLAAWSRRGYDTRCRDPAQVLQRLQRRLAPGDVLLLHDGHCAATAHGAPVVLGVLPPLLANLRALGLSARALPAATAETAAEPETLSSAARAST